VAAVFVLDAIIDFHCLCYTMVWVLLLTALYVILKGTKRNKGIYIGITILCNVIYLLWRVIYTLPFSYGVLSAVLGILLLLAELVGFLQSAVFRLIFVKPYQPPAHTLDEWETVPTVDVLIATYNEGIPILKRTIITCLNLEYPEDKLNIYLCDDGRREEARELCRELGVGYVTRENNQFAKAGNINNAMGQTDGEFILLLDADMAPKSSFLQKTIGQFVDGKVGFVQTPQVFYNPDPFQFNLHLNQRIPNEQDLFMLEIQAARARFNAVMHVGTNAVFRRKALEDIGGVPTGTITEDMATGMLLEAKGYKAVFINEVLCTGLSVESFNDLIRQRERWCRGNIQVVKKWNPLTVKGLSLAQRLIYTDGLVYWFFGVQKIIYILCPLIYLIFGTVILQASPYNLLLFWLPSYLASFLSYRVLVANNRSLMWRHIYEVAMAPYLAMAALVEAIFARPIPFRVTPKGINTDRTTFSLRTAWPFIFLLAATLLGWGFALKEMMLGAGNVGSLAVNVAWSLYNAFAIAISILVCVERPRKRIAERIPTGENISVYGDEILPCRIEDLSETGARIECTKGDGAGHIGDVIRIASETLGEVEGEVVWEKQIGKHKYIGIEFRDCPLPTYRKLLKVVNDQNKGYSGNR